MKRLSSFLFCMVLPWAIVTLGLISSLHAYQAPAEKRIVFLAGNPSHNYGSHEHYAGCRILAATLQENLKGVKCEVYRGGWPSDESILDGADTIIMYADGGGGHPSIPHQKKLGELMAKGVGFVCLH